MPSLHSHSNYIKETQTRSNYDPTYRSEEQRLKIQRDIESVNDQMIIKNIIKANNWTDVHVLDVGCANGNITTYVFDDIPEVTKVLGVDRNNDTIIDFQTNTGTKYSGHYLNVEHPDAENSIREVLTKNGFRPKVDIIYISLCIHHIGKQEEVLQKLRRLLRPGGYIFIRSCDDGMKIAYPDPENLLPSILVDTAILPHVSDRFNGRTLYSKLTNAGYKNIIIDYLNIDTAEMNKEQKMKLFDSLFLFRLDYYTKLLDANPNDQQLKERYNIAKERILKFSELFSMPDFYFAYSVPIVIAQA